MQLSCKWILDCINLPKGNVSSEDSLHTRKQFTWMKKKTCRLIALPSLSFALLFGLLTRPISAQESPYLVTYDHNLEEPGNLEVEYFSTFGTQGGGNDFHSYWLEFEYGVQGWWTTEFYVDGQSTFNDSTIFTGFRWENRLRILQHEHLVNPVLYMEYEQINEADKIIKEVEGHDIESDHAVRNSVARQTLDHELELKLLLSSSFKGW